MARGPGTWRTGSQALPADGDRPPEESVITFAATRSDRVTASLPLVRALGPVSAGSTGRAADLASPTLASRG